VSPAPITDTGINVVIAELGITAPYSAATLGCSVRAFIGFHEHPRRYQFFSLFSDIVSFLLLCDHFVTSFPFLSWIAD
jgi:hypothetical protein